jgi:tetratricopeptide (TPR) repeat protein
VEYKLEEARLLIERALSLAPNDPFITDSLGWIEYRMGNMPQARQLLERAYRLRPDAEIAAHLGEVLWVLGEKEAARKLWKESARLNADNEVLRETLKRLGVKPREGVRVSFMSRWNRRALCQAGLYALSSVWLVGCAQPQRRGAHTPSTGPWSGRIHLRVDDPDTLAPSPPISTCRAPQATAAWNCPPSGHPAGASSMVCGRSLH